MHKPKKEVCPLCKIGLINRDEITGISLYKVCLESVSFGRMEYDDCCKECEDKQRKRYDEELEKGF